MLIPPFTRHKLDSRLHSRDLFSRTECFSPFPPRFIAMAKPKTTSRTGAHSCHRVLWLKHCLVGCDSPLSRCDKFLSYTNEQIQFATNRKTRETIQILFHDVSGNNDQGRSRIHMNVENVQDCIMRYNQQVVIFNIPNINKYSIQIFIF